MMARRNARRMIVCLSGGTDENPQRHPLLSLQESKAWGDTQGLGPFRNACGLSLVSYEVIVSSVALLGGVGRPFAVFLCVRPIVVNALKCQSGGLGAHIFQELEKTIKPAIRGWICPVGTVMSVKLLASPQASADCVMPSAMQRCYRVGVLLL